MKTEKLPLCKMLDEADRLRNHVKQNPSDKRGEINNIKFENQCLRVEYYLTLRLKEANLK